MVLNSPLHESMSQTPPVHLERVLKLLPDRCILHLVGDLRQMKGA